MRRVFAPAAAAAAALAAVLALATPAAAQSPGVAEQIKKLQPKDFPSEPLDFVVVYPAGGGMDRTARIFAKYVEKHSGQKVIVTNKVGGGGLVGHTYLVSQAPKDGHTVGVVANTMWADGWLRSNGKFNEKSLEALAFINWDPLTWIVRTDGPFKDMGLKEIAAHVKAKPGEVKVATVPGSSAEFVSEQVAKASGGSLIHVPFQGGAPSITALLGGHVDISFGYYTEYRGHHEAGKVKMIGVAALERAPTFPTVATFNEELGSTDISWLVWRYAAVPIGVPADRKAWLEAVFNAAMQDPAIAEEYKQTGSIMDTARLTSSSVLKAEIEKLAAVEHDFFKRTGRLQQ